MSLKKRLARQEKAREAVLTCHPFNRTIPVRHRAPLSLAQWWRLAELYNVAMSLLKERRRAGARLLTCHPGKAEEEEALLLSGSEVYADDCQAFDLLASADQRECERLLFVWWDANKVSLLERYLSRDGRDLPEEDKAALRLMARA